jgi:serine/threonine protein kinase
MKINYWKKNYINYKIKCNIYYMDYYNKYLKYKQKYLNLKYGGYTDVTNSEEMEDLELERETIGGIIYKNHTTNITTDSKERFFIYNSINRFDENQNASIISTKKTPSVKAITIVADKYVIRIVKNPNPDALIFYNTIFENPTKYLEHIYKIDNINKVYIIFSKKYIPVLKDYENKAIMDNFNKEKWISDIKIARSIIHKLGFIHTDISLDNSLYDPENNVYLLTDFDGVKSSNNPSNKNDLIDYLDEKIEE